MSDTGVVRGLEDRQQRGSMRSRFVSLSDHGLALEGRGLASRVASAIVFFLVGAIVARELYPQMVVHHDLEYGVSDSAPISARSPVSETVSYRAGVLPSRDNTERTGGPIPPVPFEQAPQQIVKTRVATDESRSDFSVAPEKSRRTENKSARMKHSSRRSNGNRTDQPYREQSTYWATTTGWTPWAGSQSGFGFAPRQDRGSQGDRRGQFAMWR